MGRLRGVPCRLDTPRLLIRELAPMTHTTGIKETVRQYIAERYLMPEEATTLEEDDDLLSMLDSLQIVRMLMELESRYSIRVDNSELTPENLGSIANIAGFIERKLAAS